MGVLGVFYRELCKTKIIRWLELDGSSSILQYWIYNYQWCFTIRKCQNCQSNPSTILTIFDNFWQFLTIFDNFWNILTFLTIGDPVEVQEPKIKTFNTEYLHHKIQLNSLFDILSFCLSGRKISASSHGNAITTIRLHH